MSRLSLKHPTVCVRGEADNERRIPDGGRPSRGARHRPRKRTQEGPTQAGQASAGHYREPRAGARCQSRKAVVSALRPRTAEDIANEQTAEQLALRIWAAMVAQKLLSSMSALMDELIDSHLLDDDDEEGDEGWLDDHRKREKTILDEAISDGLDKYPDFAAINNLPPNPDPDIARDAEQLKDVLANAQSARPSSRENFHAHNSSG